MADAGLSMKQDLDGGTELPPPATLGGAGPVPGLIWAFRIHDNGAAEPLSIDQPIEVGHDGWIWLHLNLVDVRARQWLHAIDLPAPVVALMVSRESHQQLHALDNCVYGVLGDLARDLGGVSSSRVEHLHFAMTERLLISGRYTPLAAVDKVRETIQQGTRTLPSTTALLELIVEHVADAVDRVADKLSTDLDEIEDRLTSGSSGEGIRQELARSRRTSVRLHRQLAGLRTLFHRLEREDEAHIKQPLRVCANKLAQRLDALDHDIVELRERSRLLLEETSAAIAAQSNRAINTLTLITTAILPPTLITGIFGMNVKGLPFTEDPDGFLWTCGFLVVSIFGIYWLMRRIGAL